MLIASVLALSSVSIGLFVVAIILRSRSVAIMNFTICFIAMFVLQPWSTLAIQPPRDEDMRLSWIAAWVWVFIAAGSVFAFIYTLFINKEKVPQRSRGKRRKRRRRSKSLAEHMEETAQASGNGNEDAGIEDDDEGKSGTQARGA